MSDRRDSTPVAVRCTFIDKGECRLFKMLSPSIFGLFVHWEKAKGKARGRTVYCPDEGCRWPACRLSRAWRGYIAALEWIGAKDLWYPQMLEITEHCELDMRGIYQRGQLWELFRLKGETGRNEPVQARYLTDSDPNATPAAFDIRPTLLHLYHVDELGAHVPNPLPPRTVVALPTDCPPNLPQRKQEATPEPMSLEMRQKLQQLARGFGMPNGKGVAK